VPKLVPLGRWSEAKKELERYIADAPSDAERQWGTDQTCLKPLRQGNLAKSAVRGASLRAVITTRRFSRSQSTAGDRCGRYTAGRTDPNLPTAASRQYPLLLYVRRRAKGRSQARTPDGCNPDFQQAVAERQNDCMAVECTEDAWPAHTAIELGWTSDWGYRRVTGSIQGMAPAWHGWAKAYAAKPRHYEVAPRGFRKVLAIWGPGDPIYPELADSRNAWQPNGFTREGG